jgi:hypothetical protein
MQKNLDGMNALVRCRSLPEFLEVQSSLFRDNLELTLTNGRRIAELSARVAETAARTAAAQTTGSENRAA